MSFFVDTNVLVYARDAVEPKKQQRAHQWLEYLWKERAGRLSYQVLQEYYFTVTTKLSPGLSKDEARDDVLALEVWTPLAIDGNTLAGAWRIQDRFGFSWGDCLIVSAAQILSCDFLLTEDLQHNQSVAGITVIDPFAKEMTVPAD